MRGLREWEKYVAIVITPISTHRFLVVCISKASKHLKGRRTFMQMCKACICWVSYLWAI